MEQSETQTLEKQGEELKSWISLLQQLNWSPTKPSSSACPGETRADLPQRFIIDIEDEPKDCIQRHFLPVFNSSAQLLYNLQLRIGQKGTIIPAVP